MDTLAWGRNSQGRRKGRQKVEGGKAYGNVAVKYGVFLNKSHPQHLALGLHK